MKLVDLQRWGGWAVIAGAVLLTVWAVCWTTLLPVQERTRDFTLLVASPHWVWVSALALPALLLLIFGFTAVYSRLYAGAGWAGLAGYVLIVLAYFFQAARVTWEVFLYPIIAGYAPAAALFREKLMLHHPLFGLFSALAQGTILSGVVLFSLALLRSRAFSPWAGALILAGALVYAAGPMLNIYLAIVGVVILSAGCLLLGLKLTVPAPAGAEL
jgi:hypothetical protein